MTGIKVCDKCNYAYSEHLQFVVCPHEFKAVIDGAHDRQIKALFHKLWGRDVGTSGYNKTDWMELQRLLQTRGIEV